MNQIPRCHDFVAFRLCPAQFPLDRYRGRIAPDGHHSTRHQSDRTSCVCPDLREWYERPRPDDNVPGAPESGWYSFTSS
ncbi:hypothetical protein KCU68_g199, partial [Aureobasidium melanogenum]